MLNVATGFAPATATVSGASDPAAASARAAVPVPDTLPGRSPDGCSIDVEA